MPRRTWSAKRERQYAHIKNGYEDRGVPEAKAEELAARTVNKERREAGETKAQREARPPHATTPLVPFERGHRDRQLPPTSDRPRLSRINED